MAANSVTTGSCLCGDIKYSFTGEVALTALCHCLQCQRLTGSAYAHNLCVPASAFAFAAPPPPTPAPRGPNGGWAEPSSSSSGTPLKASFVVPAHAGDATDCGATVTYSFCGRCGVVLTKTSADLGIIQGLVLVLAGTVDHGLASVGGKTVDKGAVGVGRNRPDVELWTETRAAWITPVEGAGQRKRFEA